MTILDVVDSIKNGDFPEFPRREDDGIVVMNDNMIANFAMLLGHTLLNDIPSENAEVIYAHRCELFDKTMETVSKLKFCRYRKLMDTLDKIVEDSEKDTSCWPSKKVRNNVLLFVSQYFSWDEYTRAKFFGASEEELKKMFPDANEDSNGEVETVSGEVVDE